MKNNEKGNGGKQFSPVVVSCWYEGWKELGHYKPLAPEFCGYSTKVTSETFQGRKDAAFARN